MTSLDFTNFTKTQVLVLGQMSQITNAFLRSNTDLCCDFRDSLSINELANCIGSYRGILITSPIELPEAVLKNSRRLELISLIGNQTDGLSVTTATRRNIVVQNARDEREAANQIVQFKQ